MFVTIVDDKNFCQQSHRQCHRSFFRARKVTKLKPKKKLFISCVRSTLPTIPRCLFVLCWRLSWSIIFSKLPKIFHRYTLFQLKWLWNKPNSSWINGKTYIPWHQTSNRECFSACTKATDLFVHGLANFINIYLQNSAYFSIQHSKIKRNTIQVIMITREP